MPSIARVIVKRSIVIASVGQRMAHRPQRMQRSSSFTMADSGRPPASARSVSAASRGLVELDVVEGTIARQ